jgi:hypothetical protein
MEPGSSSFSPFHDPEAIEHEGTSFSSAVRHHDDVDENDKGTATTTTVKATSSDEGGDVSAIGTTSLMGLLDGTRYDDDDDVEAASRSSYYSAGRRRRVERVGTENQHDDCIDVDDHDQLMGLHSFHQRHSSNYKDRNRNHSSIPLTLLS